MNDMALTDAYTIEPRCVCIGCNRSMLRSSIHTHVESSSRNPYAKGCGSCAHTTWDGSVCGAGVELAFYRTSDTDGAGVPEWITGCDRWEQRTPRPTG